MYNLIIFITLIILSSCQKPDPIVSHINMNNYADILKPKNNKAVLINLWATWCLPCIEEFPDILKLKAKYQNDIDIVFISLDDEERLPEVKSFLAKMNVEFKTFIKNGPDEVLFKFMPDEFSGAIPYTIIKNSKDESIANLMGMQSFENLEHHILKAIN